jgi:hypothetical protein
MKKLPIRLLLVCASLSSYASTASAYSLSEGEENSPTGALNPVIQWNKTLLVIVRTPGAQPATMHSTRSFAIMHAAICDAVNLERFDGHMFAAAQPNPCGHNRGSLKIPS